MEMAVRAMLQSQCEPRTDDKASPLVGAVLVLPDGTADTACRGELRHGDHAEFTLLERKNGSKRLDGSMLYATLEPCAPGSRGHTKLSCAERIINARISKVWVGIEDPDPKVDRKGIKYLQDAGIDVEMFDRDLQEQIREANADFIGQALERAELAKVSSERDARLSEFESPLVHADRADLSAAALSEYRKHASIVADVGSAEFDRRLAQQGVLFKEGDGKFAPTGFGSVLFGARPRDSMPQAGLLATILYPDGSEELKDFDGPMVLIPDEAEKWLSSRLPNVVSRASSHREYVQPVPFEMIREAIVNALVHRDYDLRGAKCQLVVTADTVTIKSPGGPLPPITLQQLQSFQAPMLSRNPGLHYVFAQMELAEERGQGIKSLKDRATQSGLPLPQYSWQDPYLVLTIPRSREAALAVLAPGVVESMSDRERAGWTWLRSVGGAKSSEYAEALAIDVRNARRHLSEFCRLGLAEKVGSGPATTYRVK